ncbi:MAG TPA: F0F1 ATP synthase subunit B [Planctomycetota bacterium]|nr:F0F1 ATP synthase subunit B [Planctomycetota bacterium]
MSKRRRLASWLIVAALLLPGGLALAQEHEHPKPPPGEHPAGDRDSIVLTKEEGTEETGEVTHGLDLRALGVQLLGFTILAIILGKFAIPPAIRALRARSDRIRDELDALDRDEKAAAEARASAEKGLHDIDHGSVERMERAAREGVELREKLLREGDEGAEKVHYKAKLEVELERQKMLLELRDEVVEAALAAAAKILPSAVDRKTEDALVDQFLDELETLAARK